MHSRRHSVLKAQARPVPGAKVPRASCARCPSCSPAAARALPRSPVRPRALLRPEPPATAPSGRVSACVPQECSNSAQSYLKLCHSSKHNCLAWHGGLGRAQAHLAVLALLECLAGARELRLELHDMRVAGQCGLARRRVLGRLRVCLAVRLLLYRVYHKPKNRQELKSRKPGQGMHQLACPMITALLLPQGIVQSF